MLNRAIIGGRVRESRELAGLTQAQLAAAADVTTETISRMERGLYDPALSTLVAVADEFDIELDYLVGRQDGKGMVKYSTVEKRLIKEVTRLSLPSQKVVLKLADLLQ